MANPPAGHPHHIQKREIGMELHDEFEAIRLWAFDKGILTNGDAKTQTVKLGEEYGELCKALLDGNSGELSDAIGDMCVVLTSLAHLSGLKIEYCINGAYNVIKSRTGKMQGGSFIKDKPEAVENKPRTYKNILTGEKIPAYRFDNMTDSDKGYFQVNS